MMWEDYLINELFSDQFTIIEMYIATEKTSDLFYFSPNLLDFINLVTKSELADLHQYTVRLGH